MSKRRVYVVAKELGLDNKSLVSLFHSLGVTEVRNHMSVVGPDQVERVKRHMTKGGEEKTPEQRLETKAGAPGVIVRRGRKKAAESGDDASGEPAVATVVRSAIAVRRPAEGRASAPAAAAPASAPSQPSAAPAAPSAPAAAPEPAPVVAAPPPVAQPTPAKAESAPAAAQAQTVSSPAPVADAPAVATEQPATAKAEPVAAPPVPTPSLSEAAAVPSPTPVAGQAPAGQESRVNEAVATVVNKPEPTAEPLVAEPKGAAAAAPSAAAKTSEARPAAPVANGAKSPAASRKAAAPAKRERDPAVAAGDAAADADGAESPKVAAEPKRTSVLPPAGPAAALAAAAAAARAGDKPAAAAARKVAAASASVAPADGDRNSQKPKTGIDVWQGRPGVPMPKAPRSVSPRRVQYDAKVGGGPGAGPGGPGGPGGPRRSGPMMGGRRGPGPRRGIGSMRGRTGGGPVTQERSAHKKVVKIEGSIALQALAAKLGIKAGELLMKLMSLGMTGININSTLDSDTAKLVGEELGWTVADVAVSDDEAIAAAQGVEETADEGRVPRPPVVTVMGHVDHGKTSLLDRIRQTSVVSSEAGGITQHIGAYSVKTNRGRMAFLDTPGHAAFTAMRARGAQCTDIVVLVVAADDGVMPQTKEAVNHAKAARCPIVVAVNKIDKPDAQPERVRRELSELGLQPEEWGGETLFCEVSAATGEGIDGLLDAILLQGEMLDLRANPKRPAAGMVIEAKLDRGRGPVATVLVTEGTLRKGEGLLVGNSWGRVRAMLDENGRNVSEAGPSTPVAVIGLNEVPSAGDMVNAVPDPKKAQQIAEGRRSKERSQMSATVKISMEELARRMSQSDLKECKLIIKGDVQGSVEALAAALDELSTDSVRVNIVHTGVGAVTEGDVNLAVAAGAIIIGFNVRPAGKASGLAQKEGIEIRPYSIIYDVIDDVRATMEGLLTPTLVEEAIGEAEIRKIFKVSKTGVVAGCMVTKGVVRRNSAIRLLRDAKVIWEGTLQSLKRFKDDAKEVREGFDCGVSLQGPTDVQEGDILAAFEMKEVRPTL